MLSDGYTVTVPSAPRPRIGTKLARVWDARSLASFFARYFIDRACAAIYLPSLARALARAEAACALPDSTIADDCSLLDAA